jgi:osmotically-inducible protein OsmY
MRSDSDIKRDVEDELRWDPDIDATDIAVNVTNGVVTLAGFVRSYMQKFEAEADVKRVAGVVAVANDLEVRLPEIDERPDPEIARDAVQRIKSELPYTWEKIRVVVKSGWLKLEGEVEWNYQRERAAEAVRRVRGIRASPTRLRSSRALSQWKFGARSRTRCVAPPKLMRAASRSRPTAARLSSAERCGRGPNARKRKERPGRLQASQRWTTASLSVRDRQGSFRREVIPAGRDRAGPRSRTASLDSLSYLVRLRHSNQAACWRPRAVLNRFRISRLKAGIS